MDQDPASPCPTSASAARRFVEATLHGWRLDTLIEVVVLLIGELVTNAITHTPVTTAGIGLIVLLGDDAVRVEVHDGSWELPDQPGPGGWDNETGRGLGWWPPTRGRPGPSGRGGRPDRGGADL